MQTYDDVKVVHRTCYIIAEHGGCLPPKYFILLSDCDVIQIYLTLALSYSVQIFEKTKQFELLLESCHSSTPLRTANMKESGIN